MSPCVIDAIINLSLDLKLIYHVSNRRGLMVKKYHSVIKLFPESIDECLVSNDGDFILVLFDLLQVLLLLFDVHLLLLWLFVSLDLFD
jgi:hypothetical protein